MLRYAARLLVYWPCVGLSLVLCLLLLSCLVSFLSSHTSLIVHDSNLPSHRRNREARKLRRRATSSHGNMSPTSTTWSPIRNFKSQKLSRLPISITCQVIGKIAVWTLDGKTLATFLPPSRLWCNASLPNLVIGGMTSGHLAMDLLPGSKLYNFAAFRHGTLTSKYF